MARRLHMTNADYVAIAVSPALVMALVGSLVFFLIEVFYVGQHPARLNYVFAWFVFAAVLVARIAIEMGSERAFLFALPLGVITFLAMVRFVEQPGPLGQLINVALLGVVWWSAHKLTWDCTLIDDDEDASGEGLMQQAKGSRRFFSRRRTDWQSVPQSIEREKGLPTPSEFDDALPDSAPGWRYRSRKNNRPHAPGLWVLYFSLAALPLFGMGQRWIPSTDVGSRRYAFFLLLVYVAAGLSLLVTTSFLGLRRYLRQRRMEMPAPMAATWVGVGGALIVVIMGLVALIPRPAAEVAISRVPWTIGSSDGLARSRTGMDMDHVESEGEPGAAVDENAQDAGDDSTHSNEEQSGERANDPSSGTERSQQDERGRESSRSDDADESANGSQQDAAPQQESTENISQQDNAADTSGGEPATSEGLRAFQSLSALSWTSITDLLKWIFYFVIGLCVLVFVWKNFAQIANSFMELLRQIREFLARLFGGGRSGVAGNGADDGASRESAPLPKFHDFQNPFAAGTFQQLPPHELVRYTFEAFEAWARDNGHSRTPDQTPHELVRLAIAPQMPMHAEARSMAQLYGETAYGAGAVSREAANGLDRIWTMMHDSSRQRN